MFKKISQILIKQAFFHFKICNTFRGIKAMKKNIPYIHRTSTSEDFC